MSSEFSSGLTHHQRLARVLVQECCEQLLRSVSTQEIRSNSLHRHACCSVKKQEILPANGVHSEGSMRIHLLPFRRLLDLAVRRLVTSHRQPNARFSLGFQSGLTNGPCDQHAIFQFMFYIPTEAHHKITHSCCQMTSWSHLCHPMATDNASLSFFMVPTM